MESSRSYIARHKIVKLLHWSLVDIYYEGDIYQYAIGKLGNGRLWETSTITEIKNFHNRMEILTVSGKRYNLRHVDKDMNRQKTTLNTPLKSQGKEDDGLDDVIHDPCISKEKLDRELDTIQLGIKRFHDAKLRKKEYEEIKESLSRMEGMISAIYHSIIDL